MTTRKATKRSLWMSVLSLLLCIGMLAGTTFAWFTDSVKSENNIITAGNLDIELYWSWTADDKDWHKVGEGTNIFKDDTLWEPGHTEVIYLKVVNEGSLALKYWLGVNIADEIDGVNQEGRLFRLSDYIEFGVVKTGDMNFKSKYETREEALAAIEGSQKAISAGYANSSVLYPEKNMPEDVANARFEEYATLVVTMPEDVSNEANHNGINIPKIFLGLNVFATQLTYEKDSYGSDYDIGAPWAGEVDTRWYNTTDNAFVLTTAAQLAGLAEIVNSGDDNFSGKLITLGADIDLNNLEWTPIGNNDYIMVDGKKVYPYRFQGAFDGSKGIDSDNDGKMDSYTVSNLLITGRKNYVGLFGWAQKEIKNLTVENAKVSGNDHVAAVAGQASGALSNILLTGHVEVSGYRYVGGVAGQGAYSNWNNITVNVVDTDPNVKSYVKSDSVLYDPANPKADENGNYSKEAWTGGVLGHIAGNKVYLTNITSNIDVYGSYNGVGGAFGITNYGNVLENVTVTGNVFATAAGAECVGGIAGTLENSTQTITFNNCNFGGKILDANGNDITTDGHINKLYGGFYDENGTGLLLIDGKDLDDNWAVIDHATLVNAFEKGGKVKMYTSVQSMSQMLVVPKDVTVNLDMNGKIIHAKWGQDHEALIVNNGTLNINGNGGFINNGYHGNGTGNASENGCSNIVNNGVMTLKNVNLRCATWTKSNNDYPEYAIQNFGKLTVEEGTKIDANGGGIYTEGVGSVTEINGGTIAIPDQTWNVRTTLNIHAIYAGANSTVTIKGGNVTMGNFVNTDKVNPYSYFTVLGAAADANLAVTGGTFTGVKVIVNDVEINTGDPSDYVADGYQAVDNGNNTYTVAFTGALVNTVEQLKDALTQGGNIALTSNITSTEILEISKDTKIDLAGYDIIVNTLIDGDSNNPLFYVENGCKLVINDTTNSSSVSYPGMVYELGHQASLEINGGTHKSTNKPVIDMLRIVEIDGSWVTPSGMNVVINGGWIESGATAIYLTKGCNLTINGGTVLSTGNGGSCVSVAAGATATINGGKLERNSVSGQVMTVMGEVIMNDGLLVANPTDFVINAIYMNANGSKFTMNGGTIKFCVAKSAYVNRYVFYSSTNTTGTVDINGGTIYYVQDRLTQAGNKLTVTIGTDANMVETPAKNGVSYGTITAD